jgi:hypothetical protein
LYLRKLNNLENLVVCKCGNNTWLVSDQGMRCTSCSIKKRDNTTQKFDQAEVIQAMGIPPTLPHAIDLAKAQLNQLKKKEQILNEIQNIIDSE